MGQFFPDKYDEIMRDVNDWFIFDHTSPDLYRFVRLLYALMNSPKINCISLRVLHAGDCYFGCKIFICFSRKIFIGFVCKIMNGVVLNLDS